MEMRFERARGLDLGADDVVSFPCEALEFAAKIRTRLRQRQPELKFEAELKDALEREHLAESTAENLISKVMSRRRFLCSFHSLRSQRGHPSRGSHNGYLEPPQPQGYA